MRDGRREQAGDVLLNWLHPLHSGEALGLAGRLLVLLSGIGTVLLAVTGLLRWAMRGSRPARDTPDDAGR